MGVPPKELKKVVLCCVEDEEVVLYRVRTGVEDYQHAACNLIQLPKYYHCGELILWILSWPLQILLFITIPNIRYYCSRNCLIPSLVSCFVWVGILCYFSVWMINIMAYNFSVTSSSMGISILAFGSSVPEMIAAASNARRGK